MKAKISKDQMNEVAMSTMLMNGYHHTNVREVMESVGLGKGSLSNYYESKEDMGIKGLGAFMKKLSDWQQECLSDLRISPLERIRTYFAALIEHFKSETEYRGGCMVGNFSLELGDTDEVFREKLHLFFTEMNQRFASCFLEAQQLDEVRPDMDAEDMAELLMVTWEGAVLRMKTMGNGYALDLFFNDFFKLISPKN